MTKISIHGILGLKFKKTFVAKIDKIEDVFGFLKANNPKFEKEICDMHLNGVNYCLIVDGKKIKTKEELKLKKRPKEVHLVPILVGHGPYAAIAILVAKVISAIVALFIIVTLLTAKPPKPPSLEQSTRALEESYGINNKPNITAQGTQVPVGYGRLLIGTHVIEYAEKNYPQNVRANQIFSNGIKDDYLVSSQPPIINTIIWPTETPPEYDGWGDNQVLEYQGETYYDPDVNHGGTGPLIFRCWKGLSFFTFGYYSITTHVPEGGLNKQRFALWSMPIDNYNTERTVVPEICTSGSSSINGVQRWYFSSLTQLTDSKTVEFYLTLYPTSRPDPKTGDHILGRFTITVSNEIQVIDFDNGYDISGNCSTVYYPPCNRGVYLNYLNVPEPDNNGRCQIDSNNIPNFNCGITENFQFRAGGSLIQGAEVTYGEIPQG